MKIKTHNRNLQNYQIEYRNHDGRRYMVVPVTMMVEGVHSGSHGPVFHSAYELGRIVQAWNGIPVTLGHPKDKEGFISANAPEVIEQYALGRIYNAYMEDDKLRAEAWIEENRAKELDNNIVQRLQSGDVIEVSVGVFSDDVPMSGQWNSEEYTHIATNHRPDHLALLPNETGACSVNDGCGIRANKQSKNKSNGGKMNENINVKNHKPTVHIQDNQEGYLTIQRQIQTKLDSMDNEGTYHYLEELYDDRFVYCVVKTYDNTKHYYIQVYEYDEENDQVNFMDAPQRVRREVNYQPISANSNGFVRTKKPNNNSKNNDKKEGETDMSKDQNVQTNTCTTKKVDALIANEQTKFTEEDRKWLSGLEVNALDKLAPVEEKPQANSEGKVETKKDEPKANEQPKKPLSTNEYIAQAPKELQDQIKAGLRIHKEQRAKLVKHITTNSEEGVWTEDELNEMSFDTLEKVAKSIKANSGETTDLNDYSLQFGSITEPTVNREEEVEPLLPAGVELETSK